MDRKQVNKKLRKKGKVFQLIGLTNKNENIFYVFATQKDAEAFAKAQSFLATYQIIDIEVWSMKNK